MPYKVAQGAGCPEGKPYAVIKETDGEVMGCHPTKSAANRQLRALYAAEAFNPGQRRDQRGRFARSGTASAALDDLARGNKVDVAPGDVGGILDAAADRSDHPDLTELHVNGTPKFGLDGLGYGRADMPVLGSKHLPGFIAHVSSRGTRVSQERVDPQTLKPMQREVSASSAGKLYRGMRDGSLPDKALVVSIDNFVISQRLCASASCQTIPIVIYSSARRSPLPSLNALASITLAASTVIITLAFIVYRRLTARERRDSAR